MLHFTLGADHLLLKRAEGMLTCVACMFSLNNLFRHLLANFCCSELPAYQFARGSLSQF